MIDLKGGAKHTFKNTGTVTATIVEVFGKAPAAAADVVVTPLLHASVQLESGGKVIQVDPWSQADLARAKPADLILITDDPIHHLDPKAIAQLRKPGAPVVVPAASQSKFAEGTALANGETRTLAGVTVEAIPAYDIKPGEPSHPKGKANGYVMTLGGKRIYIAGVTECVPEIRALRNIDIAFMPMNLPLDRMTPAAAAECVNATQAEGGLRVSLRPELRGRQDRRGRDRRERPELPRRHPRWSGGVQGRRLVSSAEEIVATSGRVGRRDPARLRDLNEDPINLRDRNRLGDVVVHPRRQAPFPIAAHGMRGHRDDGNVRVGTAFGGANGGRRFESVHLGHLHVHEDRVERLPPPRVDRFPAIGHENRVLATPRQ